MMSRARCEEGGSVRKVSKRQNSLCDDGRESPSIAGTFASDESCDSSIETCGESLIYVSLDEDEGEGVVHMLAATATPRTPATPSGHRVVDDLVAPLETQADGTTWSTGSPLSTTALSVVSSLSTSDLTDSLCDGDSCDNSDILFLRSASSPTSSEDCTTAKHERHNDHLDHGQTPRPLRSLNNNRRNNSTGSSTSSSALGYWSRQRARKPIWKRAVDPATGRTYYFEQLTRKAQWEKPFELYTADEKRKKLETLQFFRDMEASLYRSFSRGELIPGVDSHCSFKATATAPTMDSVSSQSGSRTLPHMLADPPSPCSSIIPVANKSKSKQTATLAPEPLIVVHHQSANTFTPSEAPTLNALGLTTSPERLTKPTLDPKLSIEPVLVSAGKRSDVRHVNNENVVQKPSHIRRNTGGTIYVKSTISSPDIATTIRCICKAFQEHIFQKPSENTTPNSPVSVAHHLIDTVADIFNDVPYVYRPVAQNSFSCIDESKSFSSPCSSPTLNNIADIGLINCDFLQNCVATEPPFPELGEIIFFYQDVFKRANMELDTIIMTLIYVERLMNETRHSVRPTPKNWKSILFACMALASKVWDDLSMWNAGFSRVGSNEDRIFDTLASFTPPRINELERTLLKCLNFNVKVTAGEYAQYYFLLRSKLTPEERAKEAAFKPLDIEGAKALEVCSGKYQQTAINQSATIAKSRRARSLVDYPWLANSTTSPEEKVCTEEEHEKAEHNLRTLLSRKKKTLCLEQLVVL